MDVRDYDLDQLRFNVRGVDIRTSDLTVQIPVDVYSPEGVIVHRQEVLIKKNIFVELEKLQDFEDQIHRICKSRVIDKLAEMMTEENVDIRRRLALDEHDAEPLIND